MVEWYGHLRKIDEAARAESPDGVDQHQVRVDNSPSGPLLIDHKGGHDMPLYLDVHHKIDGLTTAGIADAHRKDLECQHKHGVNYLKYWFDEGTGKVFCLVQAPSKEAAEAVHREAHGAIADEIIEVKEGS